MPIMRGIFLCGVLPFIIGACGVSEGKSGATEQLYSSESFVSSDVTPIQELVDFDRFQQVYAETGHAYLSGLSPAQLMDCSVNNFLILRMLKSAPGGISIDVKANFAAEDAVFRNALFSAGFDTEEKRQAIYSDTVLAKMVVTGGGAKEADIVSGQRLAEDFCRPAIDAAYQAFESAVRADPGLLEVSE